MSLAVSVSLLLTLPSLITASVLPRAAGPPKKYVALGDSWAAGPGNLDPINDNTMCGRTKHSFAQQFAAQNNLPEGPQFIDLTCGTDSFDDILGKVPKIPADTDLVSFLGDTKDLMLPDIVQKCDLWPKYEGCSQAQQASRNYLSQTYPGKIQDLVTRIRAQTTTARIVIFGFPRVYGSPVRSCNPGGGNMGPWLADEHDSFNALLLTNINDALDQAAKKINDPNVIFVEKEVDAKFENHRYCDPQPWFYADSISNMKSESDPNWDWDLGYYHPNVDGNRAYTELLTGAWQK